MPKAGRPRKRSIPESTFILDAGADTLKAGFPPREPSTDSVTLSQCSIIPNTIVRTRDRRIYVGAQTSQITQWNDAVIRRPLEQGQLVNWPSQHEIWEHSFFDEKTAAKNTFIKKPEDTTLILTESPNTLPALQKNTDEIVMEEWGFGAYARVAGPSLNAYNDLHSLFGDKTSPTTAANKLLPLECLLLIDSGFSHTIVTPIYNGHPIQRAIRRIDLGGKHMTNLLKELFSLRHFNVTQDFKIVNDMKEDISFVSQDFKQDMEKTWKGNKGRRKLEPPSSDAMDLDLEPDMSHNEIIPPADNDLLIDYILPDGHHLLRGFSRLHDIIASNPRKRKLQDRLSTPSTPTSMTPHPPEILATVGSERFAVPEILFTPSDVGSPQPGLADAIMQSLAVLPPLLQATLLANILVVGGNANIPGLIARLQRELRSRVKTEWVVRVRKMEDPRTSTWLGGARVAAGDRAVVKEWAVTREEYLEHGSGWAGRKFATGKAA